jgi:hypothetical protein
VFARLASRGRGFRLRFASYVGRRRLAGACSPGLLAEVEAEVKVEASGGVFAGGASKQAFCGSTDCMVWRSHFFRLGVFKNVCRTQPRGGRRGWLSAA